MSEAIAIHDETIDTVPSVAKSSNTVAGPDIDTVEVYKDAESSGPSFSLFLKLPLETRLQIWREAFDNEPGRILNFCEKRQQAELDEQDMAQKDQESPDLSLNPVLPQVQAFSTLQNVNHESRSMVLRHAPAVVLAAENFHLDENKYFYSRKDTVSIQWLPHMSNNFNKVALDIGMASMVQDVVQHLEFVICPDTPYLDQCYCAFMHTHRFHGEYRVHHYFKRLKTIRFIIYRKLYRKSASALVVDMPKVERMLKDVERKLYLDGTYGSQPELEVTFDVREETNES